MDSDYHSIVVWLRRPHLTEKQSHDWPQVTFRNVWTSNARLHISNRQPGTVSIKAGQYASFCASVRDALES